MCVSVLVVIIWIYVMSWQVGVKCCHPLLIFLFLSLFNSLLSLVCFSFIRLQVSYVNDHQMILLACFLGLLAARRRQPPWGKGQGQFHVLCLWYNFYSFEKTLNIMNFWRLKDLLLPYFFLPPKFMKLTWNWVICVVCIILME